MHAVVRILLAGTALIVAAALADAPTIDPADDEQNFGPPEQALFWTLAQKVAGYRNADKLFATRGVKAGDTAYPLPEAPGDFDALEFAYDGESFDVDDYLRRANVAGLLIIHDGNIVLERYALGNTRDSRWISFSVAKSVVSMLIGAAIRDDYINSVDELVTDYLPHLKGSAYDGVTIRNLLQMASGVAWNEDYDDPESDVNTYPWYDVIALYDFAGGKPRVARPGARFNYNSAETELVGTLLRAAIGNNLSTYLKAKIWQPFGMEQDANWLLGSANGSEVGGCCISATLRDYGRIGLFALRNGRLHDGTDVLPADWMRESATRSDASADYGYLWWLSTDSAFEARGVFGQGIFVHPEHDIVIAKHGAWEDAYNDRDIDFDTAFYRAVVRTLATETGASEP